MLSEFKSRRARNYSAGSYLLQVQSTRLPHSGLRGRARKQGRSASSRNFRGGVSPPYAMKAASSFPRRAMNGRWINVSALRGRRRRRRRSWKIRGATRSGPTAERLICLVCRGQCAHLRPLCVQRRCRLPSRAIDARYHSARGEGRGNDSHCATESENSRRDRCTLRFSAIARRRRSAAEWCWLVESRATILNYCLVVLP